MIVIIGYIVAFALIFGAGVRTLVVSKSKSITEAEKQKKYVTYLHIFLLGIAIMGVTLILDDSVIDSNDLSIASQIIFIIAVAYFVNWKYRKNIK